MKRLTLLAGLTLGIFSARSQTKNFIDQPYLDITGSADTLVTPDEIYIKINISEADTKGKVPLEELENKMVLALKGIGINTQKDLTTSDLVSNFQYYFLRGQKVIQSKQYLLKVNSAVIATRVFETLQELSISNTSIDRVESSRLEILQNQMRSKAVKQALEEARALVRPLHQSIGPALYIREQNPIGNYPERLGMNELVITGYAGKGSPEQLPNIEFKPIKVSSTVEVKFILK